MHQLDSDDDLFLYSVRIDEEHYIFIFNEAHIPDVAKTFSRFASDPDLSFSDDDFIEGMRRIKDAPHNFSDFPR